MKEKLEILAALQKASEDFPVIEETGSNTHQRYAYAKLKDIYKAVRGPLNKNNIRITHQRFRDETGAIMLLTSLVHIPTGQTIDDVMEVVPERPGCQGHASSITYIKKVAIKNLCGIDAGEDDDDGEGETRYLEDIERIRSMVASHSNRESLWTSMKKEFNVQGLKDILPKDIERIIKFIKEFK